MGDDSQELVDEISTSTKMSNDAIQPVEEISTSKEMNEWAVEIGTRYNRNISHATRPSMDSNIEEKWPSIFGNWQCWDDFGVSFLPETLKWQFVAILPLLFGLNVGSCLEYLQKNVDVAWSYYQGIGKQFQVENRKRFIEHLLVTSCFLILAMIAFSGKDDLKCILNRIINESNFPNGITEGDIRNIIQFINGDPLRTRCYMFTPIHKLFLLQFRWYNEDSVIFPEGDFKHILHVLHWSRSPNGMYMVDTSRPTKMIGSFYIPSATELQLSQIVFVKDESTSHNVSYCDGTLSAMIQLSPCNFFKFSNKLYENLIKFERWYGGWCGFHFTAYMACMVCLLHTEEDVKLLRANGILESTSITDRDVLRSVQELKTFIHHNLGTPDELIILEENVMKHYERSGYRVYGEFKKRYCSNPWVIISIIAGILLFVLTFIQTLYGTLSYYKQ